MYPQTSRKPFYWLLLAILVALGVLALLSVYTYRLMQTTGRLAIFTSDTQSTITISASGTNAAIVGTGSTTVRLKPGSYLVVAGHSGKQASQVVRIAAKRSAKVHLQLSQPAAIPSPDTISYDNLQTLLNFGLTPAQVANVKQLFFNYQPSTQTIDIDSSSVQQEPHDPHGNDPFRLDFNATLDNTPVKAVVVYTFSDDVQLILTSPSGVQLFAGDSAPTSVDS